MKDLLYQFIWGDAAHASFLCFFFLSLSLNKVSGWFFLLNVKI